MNEIKYVKGDATKPEGEGCKFIIHVCNDAGGWGAGFVLSLSKRWRNPQQCYHRWCYQQKDKQAGNFCLGNVQFVTIDDYIVVCNMIAQSGYRNINSTLIPLRYDMLRKCLEKVAIEAKLIKASVHGPRFGSGLAGGDWTKIEKIIQETLIEKDISVTIYDL